jgi:DNA-binding transcriptional LysR family regulator
LFEQVGREFAAARHIVVRPDGREHLLDQFLDNKGWQRHVTLELSHFISLIALLPGGDLIATVPDDIATVLGRHIALKHIDLPFRTPQLQVQQYWHRRMQNDAANRWLRNLFYEVNRREAGAKMPG